MTVELLGPKNTKTSLLRRFVKQPSELSPGVYIDCRLVPIGQAMVLTSTLILLAIIFHLFVPNFDHRTAGYQGTPLTSLAIIISNITSLCLVFCIPLCIGAAIKLRLKVSAAGIEAISGVHHQTLYGRKFRSWSDLHTVRLRKLTSAAVILERIRIARESRLTPRPWHARLMGFLGKGWMRQGFLMLDFTSGGTAPFPLAGFSSEALENLFLSLSRWADPMTLNPDVIALQRDILTGQELHLSDSYTKMWEQSLRQRFEVTNFVPLMGGHELQGGALKVLMLLACGGLSSVYLARDRSGERVIVKEMAVPVAGDITQLDKVHEMFAREAAILAKLNHPHIVRVLDHFVEDGRDYLVLEFVPGLTLRQHVQMHGPFRHHEVIDIGMQIAELLEYLHDFSPPLIHRDITPDNLIIREPERKITLIDFGAANEFIGKVTGTLIGKQCYIPPEQFQGQAVLQSDIYALGATLHFLLTGQDPEPISTSHPQLINRAIPSPLDNIVARATEIDLPLRIRTAGEFKHLLESASSSRPGIDLKYD